MKLTEEDREAVEAYRRSRGSGPFLAADAVVVSSDGAVLLVRRARPPGRGLLALPGGFVVADETFLQAALRELVEETGLDVTLGAGGTAEPDATVVRDQPDRDPRARIVSVAHLFRLGRAAGDVPVRGGGDAAEASWVPLDALRGPDAFFADHHGILAAFGLTRDAP